MKVETNLRSGALLQDAAAAATSAASSVQNFFSVAGNQAATMTNSLANKFTSVWNCLTR
jgi:phage portal protein BeeE